MLWYEILRAILELLYFTSGIAIAVFAFLGLRQLRLGADQLKTTQEIAKTNAKREAVKLAADQCRYYAEHCVRLRDVVAKDYIANKFTFLDAPKQTNQPPFVIQHGEIVSHLFNLKALDAEIPKCTTFIPYVNALEAFAIPFAAGLADEDIGYVETARPFCLALAEVMPGIFQVRRLNAGRYESSVKLYEMWSSRLAAEMAAPAMKAMEDLMKKGSGRIKPLDHNF